MIFMAKDDREKETLADKMKHWKDFLLNSNEKIHTNDKGVLMIESLTMNNFIVDWFNDFNKDVKEKIQKFLREVKEELLIHTKIMDGNLLITSVLEIINKKAKEIFGSGII